MMRADMKKFLALAMAAGCTFGVRAETKLLKERLAEAGVTASVGKGYANSTRLSFTFEGFSAYIDEPKAPRPDCGWMWCMKWPGAFSDQTGQEDGVRRGYYYVYLDDIHWMNPAGTEKAKRFHDFLVTKLGFAPKAFLIGMSWGGFYSTRYASTYPDDVARIYLDAPVMSFHHFKYQGWKPAADAWPAPEGHDWKVDPLMPINRAEPIAKAGIPILLLYGGSDTVVAPKENCEIFIERFKAAGGDIAVFRRPAYGHHPHGFKGAGNRGKIVDFFEGRTDFTFDEAYDAIFEATTSLPDLNMRDQWKLMGDAVALTNYANLVWQTNGVAVWGRAFNRALREHAVVKVPAGDYPIEEQITIPSDRRIEADAKARIRHAPGYRGILVRNEPGARNVFVKGGVWSDDRAARNRDASGRPVNYRVLHGDNSTVFRFLGCTGLTVRDLCVSNAPAFSIQAGAVTNLVVENVVVKKGGADGVHVNGCTENVLIRNVRGLTGDDLVALNAWDWPRSTECCGPMRNVLVDNAVTDAGGYRAIRLLPGRTNRATGEWIDCRMDGIILRRIDNVDWFKAAYQGNGDPKENRMGAGSHWYFEDCDIRFERCEKAPEHTAVFDFGSDVDDVTLRYVNIDFAPREEGDERRHVAKVGPWPWEPRISPTVKKLTVENLTVNGAKPEQFFHETAYDQKGRGKFGEITVLTETRGGVK